MNRFVAACAAALLLPISAVSAVAQRPYYDYDRAYYGRGYANRHAYYPRYYDVYHRHPRYHHGYRDHSPYYGRDLYGPRGYGFSLGIGSSRFQLNLGLGGPRYGARYDGRDYDSGWDYYGDGYGGPYDDRYGNAPPPGPSVGGDWTATDPASPRSLPLPDLRIEASTEEERQQSRHSQQQWDQWLQLRNVRNAAAWYQQAVGQAEDRPEPYFRLAFAQTGLGQYGRAVENLQRGLMLDPTWPATGESLADLFGPGNDALRYSLIRDATHWAREEPRDPDRLFLLGVLLHFNGDRQRAAELLIAGLRFDDQTRGEYFRLFLQPAEPDRQLAEPDRPPQSTSEPAARPRLPRDEEFVPPPPASDEEADEPIRQRRDDDRDTPPASTEPVEPAPAPVPTPQGEADEPVGAPLSEDGDSSPSVASPPDGGPVIPQPNP